MKKLIILLVFIFLLSGCSNNEEVVNILNWSSYIPNEVIKDFEHQTGIKVNYNTYSSLCQTDYNYLQNKNGHQCVRKF